METAIKYSPNSSKAAEFINDDEILDTIKWVNKNAGNTALIEQILKKSTLMKGLSHREAALLLACDEKAVTEKIKTIAKAIKQHFYGNRIVLFAPLYLSNYCVNNCVYCPYHRANKTIPRIKLSQDQIRAEVTALQDMGHKRLAIEAGEDPINNPLEYILESIETIYSVKHKSGAIRRVNVNIAADTIDNYKKLHDAKIGTYILFQETYNKKGYEKLHPGGPKGDYNYHTEAMDRAMAGGIEDVGLGVLFGLENYLYEFIGLIMHAEHLEAAFGVGPHTISVPRVKPADGIDPEKFDGGFPDEIFEKLIALIRVTVPYTGMIISTRENARVRKSALELGVSQISGASRTSVGGYVNEERDDSSAQFDVSDQRSLDEVIVWLMEMGYVPSFCTACYREGRVGGNFMKLLKGGHIAKNCQANALMTLSEYLHDYGSDRARSAGENILKREINTISDEKIRTYVSDVVNNHTNDKFI
jgi:2-iminoacetate synthase